MNKFITALVFLLGMSGSIFAQVGIGTTTPEASAALDISSTDKGFLMPRMTTVQREAITSPVNALKVFDLDTKSEWTYVDGAWAESKAGVGKFIDGASPDIAYYPDRVGIGLDDFSTVHKLYVESIKTTDGTHTGSVFRGVYDGTGNSTSTNALTAVARNNSTGTITSALGTRGKIENPNSGGTINTGVGSWGEIDNAGTINTAVGTWPQIMNSGNMNYAAGVVSSITNTSGDINLTRGIDIGVTNQSGGTMTQPSLGSMWFSNEGTITGDGYGLFIGGAGSGSVGGNSYALYVATPFSNVAGNAYAIYSDNLNASYIEGNLGVGTNDPQQKVHVSGVLRLEPQSAPPTGGAGDIYAGADNKLYFHNGTEWKEILLAP